MGQRQAKQILRRDQIEARGCCGEKIGRDSEHAIEGDDIGPMKMLVIAILYCATVLVSLGLAWLS